MKTYVLYSPSLQNFVSSPLDDKDRAIELAESFGEGTMVLEVIHIVAKPKKTGLETKRRPPLDK